MAEGEGSGVNAGFAIGDLVIRNRETWVVNDFDGWGRGEGVGIVVEPPFELEPDSVDVRWPHGRCFEDVRGLLPAPPGSRPPHTPATDPGA